MQPREHLPTYNDIKKAIREHTGNSPSSIFTRESPDVQLLKEKFAAFPVPKEEDRPLSGKEIYILYKLISPQYSDETNTKHEPVFEALAPLILNIPKSFVRLLNHRLMSELTADFIFNQTDHELALIMCGSLSYYDRLNEKSIAAISHLNTTEIGRLVFVLQNTFLNLDITQELFELLAKHPSINYFHLLELNFDLDQEALSGKLSIERLKEAIEDYINEEDHPSGDQDNIPPVSP